MLIDEHGLHVYHCSDNRYRCYNPTTHKVMSYPKALIEFSSNTLLSSEQQIHHIDGDVTNNDMTNLMIVQLGDHQHMHRKYYDREMVCPECNTTFIWTAKQQRYHFSNKSRKTPKNLHQINAVFCSKKCLGKYTRREQLERQNTQ